MEKVNFTLAMDREILRKARKAAAYRDTSVNELVRQYIEGLANEQDRRATALTGIKEIFRTSKARIRSAAWTRDELHER